MIYLTQKKCVACEGGTLPLVRHQIAEYELQVPQWKLSNDALSISRQFEFKNFKEAVSFVDAVAAIAEDEGHHPDISLFDFKKVLITLSTHAIGGLSENDFIVAAKIDAIKK